MSGSDKKEWVDWLDVKVLQKAAVVDEEGNILVIKRVAVGPAARPGKWDLPGGSLGPDDLVKEKEPLIEALKREIWEEVDLEVTEITPIYVSSWVFSKSPGKILGVAIGYKCKVTGMEPLIKLSNEHIEYRWLSRGEILSLDFGEDGGLHKGIVEKLG